MSKLRDDAKLRDEAIAIVRQGCTSYRTAELILDAVDRHLASDPNRCSYCGVRTVDHADDCRRASTPGAPAATPCPGYPTWEKPEYAIHCAGCSHPTSRPAAATLPAEPARERTFEWFDAFPEGGEHPDYPGWVRDRSLSGGWRRLPDPPAVAAVTPVPRVPSPSCPECKGKGCDACCGTGAMQCKGTCADDFGPMAPCRSPCPVGVERERIRPPAVAAVTPEPPTFEELVKRAGPLPMTAMATSGAAVTPVGEPGRRKRKSRCETEGCGKPCKNLGTEGCMHDAAHPTWWGTLKCRDAGRCLNAPAAEPPGVGR